MKITHSRYFDSLVARFAFAAAALTVLISHNAQAAGLTLTAAGIADGFSVSTFATLVPGNNGCCGGPFGLAISANGNVIVNVGGTGTRYAFSDVDGQTPGSAINSVSSNSFVTAYASAGGQAYGSDGTNFVQFNNNATVNHILTGVTAAPYLGMWGNPVNGHIIATSSAGLIDIDPLAAAGAGTFRVINGQFGDGVSVSPDGSIAYLEQGNINGYNISTGLLTASYAVGCSGPDGTGVIQSSNSLNGQILVNCNDGQVGLINPLNSSFTVIATQATRGDYVAPDITNGTLLLDFADTVERLSCGPNCGIGSGPSSVPEPSTLGMFGISLAALGFVRRRARANQA